MSEIKKSCDVLVIGGGGSGLVAGCRAASLGSSVIVLEKTDSLGGGMNSASTMRTFGSNWQKERDLPDTSMDYLRNRMDETFWRIDRKLATNVIKGTGEFFDWFWEIAPQEYRDYFTVGRYVFDDPKDGPLGPQSERGPGSKGSGRIFVEVCSQKLTELGGEILMGAAVEDVAVENGKIVSATVKQGEDTLTIDCKNVVLACGAWIRKPEFVEKYYPQLAAAQPYMGESPHMARYYTGDGLEIAEKAGALMDTTNLTIRMMGPMTMCRSRVLGNMANSPYSIYVNKNGERFVSEVSQLRLGVFDSGSVVVEQPEGKTFVIFDDAAIKRSIADGDNQPKPQVPMPSMMAGSFPKSEEEAYEDINKALEAGDASIVKVDTIEQLAAAIEVPVEALKETIENYNAYCAEGKDWDCYKPTEWLQPINAPYYAVKGSLGTDGAFGGVEINEVMQAKAAAGGVVDGLYITGDLASGRFINMAGIKKQIINDMSFALSSGFIAGTQAAK